MQTGWITEVDGDYNSLPAVGRFIISSFNLSVTSSNNQALSLLSRNGCSQKVTITFVNMFVVHVKILLYAEILNGLIFDSVYRS